MFPNFEKFIKTLEVLDLDPEKYMITGSGSLAVRGIRDCVDLDVLVTDELGESLKQQYPERFRDYSFCDEVQFDGVELMWNIKEKNRPFTTAHQLEEADVINGKRYQTLERIKFFKQRMNREKDRKDLEAIQAWENLQKNKKSV